MKNKINFFEKIVKDGDASKSTLFQLQYIKKNTLKNKPKDKKTINKINSLIETVRSNRCQKKAQTILQYIHEINSQDINYEALDIIQSYYEWAQYIMYKISTPPKEIFDITAECRKIVTRSPIYEGFFNKVYEHFDKIPPL